MTGGERERETTSRCARQKLQKRQASTENRGRPFFYRCVMRRQQQRGGSARANRATQHIKTLLYRQQKCRETAVVHTQHQSFSRSQSIRWHHTGSTSTAPERCEPKSDVDTIPGTRYSMRTSRRRCVRTGGETCPCPLRYRVTMTHRQSIETNDGMITHSHSFVQHRSRQARLRKPGPESRERVRRVKLTPLRKTRLAQRVAALLSTTAAATATTATAAAAMVHDFPTGAAATAADPFPSLCPCQLSQ